MRPHPNIPPMCSLSRPSHTLLGGRIHVHQCCWMLLYAKAARSIAQVVPFRGGSTRHGIPSPHVRTARHTTAQISTWTRVMTLGRAACSSSTKLSGKRGWASMETTEAGERQTSWATCFILDSERYERLSSGLCGLLRRVHDELVGLPCLGQVSLS